jgi:transposase
MRSQGRAAKGKRAVVKTPPSKGKNLQVQCAVSIEDGLMLHQLQRGSINMDVNASFIRSIYDAVKDSETYRNFYDGKSVVIVLDDAPAHNQTDTRLAEELGEHSDLVLLRLGPYSPMLNPIEGTLVQFCMRTTT